MIWSTIGDRLGLNPERPAGCRRPHRVTVLLIGIIALSIGDLVVTLTHLQTVGMMEANPLAAFIIRSTESPWALSIYKAITVGISVFLIYLLRRRVEGEVAAWCGVMILVAMTLMWGFYAAHLGDLESVRLAQTSFDTGWLRLD